MKKGLGTALLGIWLILTNVLPYMPLHFTGMNAVLALLGLAAGILILVGR